MLGMGMNPKQMQAMFKQLGMKAKEIEAKKVVIQTDSGDITIANPKVTEITMQGVKTFQIMGDVVESKFSEEDIKFVMENTGADKDDAEKALDETNGDIAEAISKLSQ